MLKNQIIPSGFFSEELLEIIENLPKHEFIEGQWQGLAYSDMRIPLFNNRTMLAPLTLALMLQACDFKPSNKVLDIACGNGYSTVIISKLVAEVVGVEANSDLSFRAAQYISNNKINNISIKLGELLAGAIEAAPYDVIFINGALKSYPHQLLAQLNERGRLLLVEEHNHIMKVVKYTNINGNFQKTELFDAYADFLEG